MLKRVLYILALLCTGSVLVVAQSKSNDMPLRELPLSAEPVLTDVGNVAAFGPIMCDDTGNIYARFFTGGDPTQGPIRKINAKGQTTRIEMPRDLGEDPQQMLLFAVSRDGDVYEVLRVGGRDADKKLQFKTLLVVFSRTGTLKSRTQFPFGFIPSILIPLANDEVLIGGAKIETAEKGTEGKQFLSVFSSSGEMKREFLIAGLEKNAPEGGPVNPQFGRTQLGPDGNLYLLVNSSPPSLKVITQTGKVIRRISLQEPSSNSAVRDFFVSPNQVLVEFGPKPESRGKVAYVLYDSDTGNPIQAYRPSFSGNAACWDGKEVQVIVADKNRTGFLIGKAALP